MTDNNGNVVLTENDVAEYKKKLINKCFAILGIYEDCEKIKSYDSYLNYLNRIKIEMIGFQTNTNYIQLISIINILTGMQKIDDINHSQVKSLVFHIISTIQKMEV